MTVIREKIKLYRDGEDDTFAGSGSPVPHLDVEDVLRSLPYPLLIINPYNYKIEVANEHARKVGYVIGSFCYLHHKRDKSCSGEDHPCHLDEVKNTCQPVMAEHVHYGSNDAEKIIEVHTYPILDENGEVSRVIETMLDITCRRHAESEQERAHERLLIEQIRLRSKNIALKEIMDRFDDEKHLIVNRIGRNLNLLINPLFRTLYNKTEAGSHEYISLLESTLYEITSPYISNLESKFPSLSAREIQISYLIKNGKTSKEIASTLSISTETVNWYRKAIRKKLGLVKAKTRLCKFLSNFK